MTLPTDVELPDHLAIFPLTGVLLLPGTRLPLHVFEPRYRAMVEDALASEAPIGMIQPFVPADDGRGPVEDGRPGTGQVPALYDVGCAGTIETSQRLDDGRWVVLLAGWRRFRVASELPERRGYRRVVPDWTPYEKDGLEELDARATQRLTAGMEAYGKAKNLEFDFDAMSELPGSLLLHGVAAALPFSPAERQALLEAPTLEARLTLLLDLLTMEIEAGAIETGSAPN